MNILDALQMKGIEYRQYNTTDKNEYVMCCLFCLERGLLDEDLKYKLGFNIQSGDAHCFRCGWGFRRFGIKKLAEAIDMLQMVDDLGDVPELETKKTPDTVDLPEDFDLLYPKPRDHWGKKAYVYLHDARGVKNWQIKKHKIGYSITGRYAFRIVMPVYWGKKLKGLVGRSFADQEPKYLNTEGMKCIYGIPKRNKHEVAILVEGGFDRFSIERALGPYNHADIGALLGHSLTDFQLKQLKGYKRLIIWPDGDRPGIKGSVKVAEELKRNFELFMIWPRMGYDPGELKDPTILKMLGSAKLYSQELKMKLLALAAFEE